jgi:hypothetical protein
LGTIRPRCREPERSPRVERAFELALTPGAAEKVIVTFDDALS